MKQFIVLAAILPILMLFLAQFMLDGQRQVRMNAAEDAVHTFCLEGSYYGRIGQGEIDALRQKLAFIFRSSPADISVDIAPVREGVLSYRIVFPVGKIMAGANLMRLQTGSNDGFAVFSGEVILPPPEKPAEPPQDAYDPESQGYDEQDTDDIDQSLTDPDDIDQDQLY